MISSQQEHDSNRGDKVKKPYATPTIQTFGDLRKITQTINQNKKNDNPGGSKT